MHRWGKYDEAREQLETAVRLDPRIASAYYTLGRLCYRLGLTTKSRAALDRLAQAKSQEDKESDPIGATVDVVVSTARSTGAGGRKQ
jgi:tetratricopeptide (TPR) repeat protein